MSASDERYSSVAYLRLLADQYGDEPRVQAVLRRAAGTIEQQAHQGDAVERAQHDAARERRAAAREQGALSAIGQGAAEAGRAPIASLPERT